MGQSSASHADVVGSRMGRIPQRRWTISPSLIGRHGCRSIVIMIVLTFGIDVSSEPARLVDLAHRPESRVEIRRLEHHVLEAAGLLHSLVELIGLLERAPHGRYSDRNMLTVLQHFDTVLYVVRRIGGAKHRLDRIVLNELFK